MKSQVRIDEFAFVLLAAFVLIAIMMFAWTTPTEVPPTVEPTSKSLSILNGSSKTFELNITGPSITNVTLTSTGTVSSWISFSENHFDVPTSKIVTVFVDVPSNIGVGTYEGSIKVESTGGSKIVPITIHVLNISTIKFSTHQIPLGDFSVRYNIGSKILDSKTNFQVYQGYFSGNHVNLIGVLNENEKSTVSDAYVRLIIDDTNELGNLIVEFNDKEIYNQPTNVGEVIIPINVSELSRSNVVKIKASSPGWRFWSSTSYSIRNATFVVDFKGINSTQKRFTLTQSEIDGFDHFVFSSLVSSPNYMPILRVRINNQIAYIGRPPVAAVSIEMRKDILGNPLILNPGENTISFSLDEQGYIDFTNAILTVYYLA